MQCAWLSRKAAKMGKREADREESAGCQEEREGLGDSAPTAGVYFCIYHQSSGFTGILYYWAFSYKKKK